MTSENHSLFVPLDLDAVSFLSKKKKTASYWLEYWTDFKRNRLGMFGLGVLLVLIVLAIIGPFISPYMYYQTHLPLKNTAPCADFWFGTDELGRDLFCRVFWGARISLFIGFLAASIDVFIGVIYGAIAAYVGGKTDNVMMRFVDILSSIPSLLFIILFMVILTPGVISLILALTITGWISMARIVRGQILQSKKFDYVKASKALGASHTRILFSHLIPSATGAIITTMTFTIPTAIFAEAFLSFLGLGIQAPIASLGSMINEGISALRYYPWRLFIPAVFLSTIMLSCNLLGDALHDLFDPRLKK